MNNSLTSAKHLIDAALERYTDQILEKASRLKAVGFTSLQWHPAVNHRQVNCCCGQMLTGHEGTSSAPTLLLPGRG